jgi:pimeloyl-ACP methyl ester carboxylesterase
MWIWKADRSVEDLAPRWAKPPSRFIAIDGMDVHVRDEGPGGAAPAIVLVHGTGNSLHTWDGWAKRLKDSYRVVRFDRPGFGLTGPNPSGDYTMGYYAGFLRRFLDVMGIERCIVAGNSAGGSVAWHFAVAEPGRVERLVLLASAGYPRTVPRPIAFRLAMSPLGPFILHVLPRSIVESNVRRAYGDPSKVTQEVIDRSYEIVMRAGVRSALGSTLLQMQAADDFVDISRITTPTLIMWGTKDSVIPESDAQRFAADIKGSELVMLAGVGHLPQEEEPEATVAVLRRFLAEPK